MCGVAGLRVSFTHDKTLGDKEMNIHFVRGKQLARTIILHQVIKQVVGVVLSWLYVCTETDYNIINCWLCRRQGNNTMHSALEPACNMLSFSTIWQVVFL